MFSATTVAFTIAVAKIGPGVYSRAKPATIAAVAATVAGLGMLCASQATQLVSVAPLFVYVLYFPNQGHCLPPLRDYSSYEHNDD